MNRKLYKILNRKKDCVLLMKVNSPAVDSHQIMYQVRDIENDVIYMGYIHDEAVRVFEEYDINKVRRDRKSVFLEWLNEFAEA